MFYFLAKKQERIVGYQDMLIYLSITNIINILLKLSVIVKSIRKILAVINLINKRKYFVIDQSSEKSIYFPSFPELQLQLFPFSLELSTLKTSS